MCFDKIFDLTAGVYLNIKYMYIYISAGTLEMIVLQYPNIGNRAGGENITDDEELS